MTFPDGELLVFVKAPLPGEVKTRLISALGKRRAASVHAALVRRALGVAVEARLAPVSLWCSPSPAHPFFEECRTRYGVALHAQEGEDLGRRMAHALERTLEHRRYAVLIGTDCPALSAGDLAEAFTALERGFHAVLGPAEDGGYVLIGSRCAVPELFCGIEWGTGRVLAQTRERLAASRLCWYELAVRWDVDRQDDFIQLEREMPQVLESSPDLKESS